MIDNQHLVINRTHVQYPGTASNSALVYFNTFNSLQT